MKTRIIEALVANAEGNIAKHKMNVEVYLNNPVGVGEHSDILETVQTEIDKITHYEDQLATIRKHFVTVTQNDKVKY
jgi:hypothetical protein